MRAPGNLGMENPSPEENVPERPLTAEEKAAGSDDPVGQSETIMEDSEARTAAREASPGTFTEHRTSAQATPPVPDEQPGDAATPVEEHPEGQTDG